MIREFGPPIVSLAGILDNIFHTLQAEQQRKHELAIKELSIIENCALRDEYVQQLILDRILAPLESAQHTIQNGAKHAQWLAQIINYYYPDHGLNQEQAHDLSTQLRQLAVRITQIGSLHDLKTIYAATTLFADKVAIYKHREMKYCLERSIRKGILEPLNTCIANINNFQCRAELMGMNSPSELTDMDPNYINP